MSLPRGYAIVIIAALQSPQDCFGVAHPAQRTQGEQAFVFYPHAAVFAE